MSVRTAGQRGQALVGVMVVMLILFALAGAVAVGASTVLSEGGRRNTASGNDYLARSAVSDTVAQIAGSTARCGAPPPLPSPTPTASPSPPPPPLSLSLPPNSAATQAFCAREDAVVPDSLRDLGSALVGSALVCTTFQLGTPPNTRLAVFFDMRATSRGWASIDTSPTPVVCNGPLPGTAPPAPCSRNWVSDGLPPVTQVALSCDFHPRDHVYLHMSTLGAGPKHVFIAGQDPAANPGSIYLLASGIDPANPAYEESILFVSRDGRSNRLLYEAPL
jgi:hypothetical protein